MDKDKGGFMLDKDRLARVHREEHNRKYLHFIYHMHIEKVHREYSQLIVLHYIGRGETIREPDQEQS